MSRRADPERLCAARRGAMLRPLIGDGDLQERTEEWIARWGVTEGRPGDGGYWDAGSRWIQARLTTEVEPDG
jgi:hypothetical protein